MRNMNALLHELAVARQKQFEAEQAYKDAFEQFLQGEGGLLKTAAEGAKGYAEIIEAAVRAAAVEHYHETGDTHPTPALNIRMTSKFEYDPEQARDWAIEVNQDQLLTVDKKALETFAKQHDDLVPTEVARFVKVPTPAIATDLSSYLPEKGDDRTWPS